MRRNGRLKLASDMKTGEKEVTSVSEPQSMGFIIPAKKVVFIIPAKKVVLWSDIVRGVSGGVGNCRMFG
jgi:hypothetical protein